ncbi:MAG TPA: VOC family protein [Methanoculleus sp.]|nr:VOC family protein [Methanoculleus sp.]
MLSDKSVWPVLPVADMNRAKDFYTSKLGLSVEWEKESGTLFAAGQGAYLFMYEHGPTRADHTVAAFRVQDLEAEMQQLRNRGISFEEYDLPGLKTKQGIAAMSPDRAAWFKDSEGNIIALVEFKD